MASSFIRSKWRPSLKHCNDGCAAGVLTSPDGVLLYNSGRPLANDTERFDEYDDGCIAVHGWYGMSLTL